MAIRKHFSLLLVGLLLLLVTLPSAPAAGMVHLPILIDGDSDWTAANGVRGGTGTAADPFIIEGWTIVGFWGPAIEIRNTDAHARIIDNHLALTYPVISAGYGILLDAASNITIAGNDFSNNNNAMIIRGGSNIEIEANNIYSSVPHGPVSHRSGIMATDVHAIHIVGNVLRNLDKGIHIGRSTNFTINDNTIDNVRSNGITAGRSSTGQMVQNEVNGCAIGLGLDVSSYVTLANNSVAGCKVGVFIMGPDGNGANGVANTVMKNHVSDSRVGMWYIGCDDCVVAQNLIERTEVGVDLSPRMKFENNTVRDLDTGILHWKAWPARIRNNSILQNDVNILVEREPLDARWNWFGSADGPPPETMVGDVTYDPWLIEPPPLAP